MLKNEENWKKRVKSGNDAVWFWHATGYTGPLSQWYFSTFQDNDGIVYRHAEQYMMYQKAMLFKDYDVAAEIIETKYPKDCKALGRQVKNFDINVWATRRYGIVLEGNQYKFAQNEKCKEMLLSTGDKVLIEASPLDLIWGIGMSKSQALESLVNGKKKEWGLNLLGRVLMDVRAGLG